MKRQYIKSSGILSIGYDAGQMILEVEFVTKNVYRYYKVPASEYENLMNAESRGEYFNKVIRAKQYEFEKIK